MPIRSRHIAREMGTALAVLAVYVLVLLAPLHQAAGLQRDLSQLGTTAPDPISEMVEKAKKYGFYDDASGAIRVHVEYY